MNDEFGSKRTIYQKGLILKKLSLVDGFFVVYHILSYEWKLFD